MNYEAQADLALHNELHPSGYASAYAEEIYECEKCGNKDVDALDMGDKGFGWCRACEDLHGER